ncbi:hypothetical protein F2Q69_00023111 [Brassica cretica]|uniref:Uncharacterized protein n=1 Tax=Brassica cretica TaxID=69181 RepID=A0A8S9QLE5_BRACR|nr:hypothetical protein F2Q69_00023111 [Brassica cretica]
MQYIYVYIVMSRDYVSGWRSRDVWTSDAALVGGDSETSGLATQIVWGVGAEMFAFDAALEGGGTEIYCTRDAAYASYLFMLELNFHSESSIYSSQSFACLASYTSRSNSPVTHPSYSFPFQCDDLTVVRGDDRRARWDSDLDVIYNSISELKKLVEVIQGGWATLAKSNDDISS